jgi:large subunit ribosomal protein L5
MKEQPRLKQLYTKEIRKQLIDELKLSCSMEAPVFQKVVVNVGVGDAVSDSAILESVMKELALITGQRPVKTYAKSAISAFKIRKGDVIGVKVTLRGSRMWHFIDKLVNVVFPRTKDFRGVSSGGFDGRGNYTVGVEEQMVFPEINANEVTKLRGMEITIVTSTRNDDHARLLLNKFGFPFSKDGKEI